MLDVLVFGGLLAVIGAGAVGAFYARRALAPIRASLVLPARRFGASASSPPTRATSCAPR